MPNYWQRFRTIVLDPRAQLFVDENSATGARFNEHWDGIVWLLCRTPNISIPRSRQEPKRFLLLVSEGAGFAGTRDVWILYSYDDQEVVVHGVSFGT